MAAMVLPKKPAKHRQKPPKKRGPYTPPPVQVRVVAKHLTGRSNCEIARQEGIDRGTVGRILSQTEVIQQIARYQAQLLNLVPEAINVYKLALAGNDLNLAAATPPSCWRACRCCTGAASSKPLAGHARCAGQGSPRRATLGQRESCRALPSRNHGNRTRSQSDLVHLRPRIQAAA